ncbi:MAG: Ppx/GppA family phosphatase [Proteobacteria bacterium]|nr:Ppx/GppA family phosphatase [Pseudomonadota bacterium]
MTSSAKRDRVAVIDIGTNTLLLLIAEPGNPNGSRGLRAVHEDCRFGRLGKGLDKTGALDSTTVERSLAILRDYRAIIDESQVAAVCAVGTQALREAHNAADFLGPAETILGASIDVIAGEREAQLVYRAVSESFPDLAAQTFAIADVGGGSTEIVVATPTGVESFTSIPIGSVRLHERHLHSDPPMPEQVKALIADVDIALAQLDLPHQVCLVGTAGTATSIASVELKLREYDTERVNGLVLPREVVERQLAQHLQLTVAERRRMPGLEPQRADVIAAGVTIFARLLARLDAPRFLISDRGIRWGLAHELAAPREFKADFWRRGGVRGASAASFRTR